MATPIRIFRARRLRAITCRRVYTWGAMEHIRYSAACCQTDLSNPIDRGQMRANTDRMLSMIDSAVAGAAPFLPVRLLVFPEFAHPAPVFVTAAELIEKLAVPIPNEHTDRIAARARKDSLYVQTGSIIQPDPKWPRGAFNSTPPAGPAAILCKYPNGHPCIPSHAH